MRQETPKKEGNLNAAVSASINPPPNPEASILSEPLQTLVQETLPRLYNKLNKICKDENQFCEVAEPILLEMFLALKQVDPNKDIPLLKHVHQVVQLNFRIVHDFSNLWRLDDYRLRMPQRLRWMYFELNEMCIEAVHGSNRIIDHDIQEKLAGYRKFFAESKTGIPKEWELTYNEEKKLISKNEIFAPIRMLGAEIFLFRKNIECDFKNANTSGFFNNVILIVSEVSDLISAKWHDFGNLDTDSIMQHLDDIASQIYAWQARRISVDNLIDSISKIYRSLSDKSVLSDIPDVKAHGLSLLEFNTDYSGLPHPIIPELVNLERQLLIDPNIEGPQEGLGRVIGEAERTKILSYKGARLFALMKEESLLGFYILLPNPHSVPDKIKGIYQALNDRDIIPSKSRYGWCDTLGVSRQGRFELAKLGVSAHKLLDQVICQTALWENSDRLYAYTRANNVSWKSLHRMGWQETGYEFLGGVDSKTTYKVIQRNTFQEINPEIDGVLLTTPDMDIAEIPHYRVYSKIEEDEKAILNATTITDEEALRLAQQFTKVLGSGFYASCAHGSLGYYILVYQDSGSRHNIHQLRPRTDYWEYFNTGFRGSLSEVLNEIRNFIYSYKPY